MHLCTQHLYNKYSYDVEFMRDTVVLRTIPQDSLKMITSEDS